MVLMVNLSHLFILSFASNPGKLWNCKSFKSSTKITEKRKWKEKEEMTTTSRKDLMSEVSERQKSRSHEKGRQTDWIHSSHSWLLERWERGERGSPASTEAGSTSDQEGNPQTVQVGSSLCSGWEAQHKHVSPQDKVVNVGSWNRKALGSWCYLEGRIVAYVTAAIPSVSPNPDLRFRTCFLRYAYRHWQMQTWADNKGWSNHC